MHQPVENDCKGTEKLKYAIVELIAEKGRASTIECGLLRGIGEDKEGDDFLWMVTNKKVARGCSLAYYNILSVVTFDGRAKVYTFFMADEDEQKEARKVAEGAYEGLKDLASVEGTELLDISKFQDVPKDFDKLNIVSNVGSAAQQYTGTPTGQGQKDWYGKGSHSNFTTPTYTADPTPFSWKRKTRKPTKKALEALREKLDLIAKREYEFAPRTIKGEKKKGKEAKNDNDHMFQGYDDDNFPFGT